MQWSTRCSLDYEVFTKDDGDLGFIDPTRNAQRLQVLTCERIDSHKQTIHRVIENRIGSDVRANSRVIHGEREALLVSPFGEERLFKTVGINADRGIGTQGDAVVQDQRT